MSPSLQRKIIAVMKCIGDAVFTCAGCADASETAAERYRADPWNRLSTGNTDLLIPVTDAGPVECGVGDENRAVETDPSFIDDCRADRARPVDYNILRTAELAGSRDQRQ